MHSETQDLSNNISPNRPRPLNLSPQSQSPQSQSFAVRTRCPSCRKLFAVDLDVILGMVRAGAYQAEFHCTSELCKTPFALPLPLPDDFNGVEVLPSVQLELVEPEPKGQAGEGVSRQLPGESVPLQLEMMTSTVEEPSTFKECPRCRAKNDLGLPECARCGVVFEKYVSERANISSRTLMTEDVFEKLDNAQRANLRMEEEISLGGTRELSDLWDTVMEDYEDRIRHDRFVNACRDVNALSYGAKKYSQILVSAPQDETARLMRNKIVGLVTAQAEVSRIPIHLNFRIPSLNSMGIFMGSILFAWGVMMPQLKNIMEIGLSMVLLSIGVRLALKVRI